MTFRDESWMSLTPEGFFEASSPQALDNIRIVRALDVCSTDRTMRDRLYDILHRPDLVQEKLAGDPKGKVKAAAATAQLDLERVCFGPDAKQDQRRHTDTGQKP